MASRLLAKEHAAFDPLLGVEEAAQYLAIHSETLLAKARRREISCVKAKSGAKARVKFRLSALNSWVRENEIKATSVKKSVERKEDYAKARNGKADGGDRNSPSGFSDPP